MTESTHAPKQARSERTLQKLLSAARELIDEKGFKAVSVSQIANHAGTSVGGFYGRFKDKEELLVALHKSATNELQKRLTDLANPEFWGAIPLRLIVRGAIVELVDRMFDEQNLKAAFLAAAANDPERWSDGIGFRDSIVTRMTELMMTKRKEIGHPDPEKALRFVIHVVFATVDQHILYPNAPNLPTKEAFAEELTRLFVSYLQIASDE